MSFLPAWFPFQKRRGVALETKDDPTYGVQMQFFTPGQPIFSDRNYRSFVSEGYKRCGTAYACINKIAGGAAGIKWKLYTDRTMTREIPEHPLLDLWRKPNPRNGTGSFVEQSFGYWHLSGNMYTWANRPNLNEPPVELWQLRPDLVKIVAGESDVQGYVYGYNTAKARVFDTAEIMHMRFHSYDDEFYGLSPLQVAMWLIDQTNEGNAWNTALMQNAGKPASVFTSKGYLTVEQRNQVRQEILRRYSGKRNAGFPLILEADMSWQQMSMSPYELDWLQSRELNTREIAAILDVAPELVGDSAGKTFANQHEARQALFTENILPKMDRYVDEVNGWLMPMYPDLDAMGAYFTYDKKDIETLAQLYAEQDKATSDKATGLWNTGQCDLYTAQELQGIDPDKNGKGIYKLGAILVRSQDLQAYAKQALQKPAAPPSPVPENLLDNPPPTPGLPAPTKPLALPAPQGGTNANDSNNTGTSGNADTSANGSGNNPSSSGADAANNSGKSHAVSPYRSRTRTKALDLTTKEQKSAYLAQMEDARATWEKKAVSRLTDYFHDEQKAVVDAVKHDHTGDPDTAIQEALVSTSSQLRNLIVSLYQDVGTDIGGQVAQSFSDAKSRYGYPRKSLPDVYSAAAIQYLLTLAGTKINQISGTTLAYLRQIMADAVANGDSTFQIATAIEDAYSGYIIPVRAQTIAATEVCAASNWASIQAAQSSGLTLNKVWLASMDGHTRPAHAEADGQTVPMNEPFEVGGEQLDYPGAPGGSAGNVVNCFPFETEVAAQDIQAATKRWYEGEVVEIETLLGDKLSGTPNHPVLTDRGWVALGELKEGDSVVSSRLSQEVTSSDLDIQHKPTLIGEIFDTLSQMRHSQGIARINVNFHGDIPDSDIEVVFANGLLRDDIRDTALSEPLDKEHFTGTNLMEIPLSSESLSLTPFRSSQHISSGVMSSLTESKSLVCAGSTHPQVHALGTVPSLNASVTQKAIYDMAGNVEVSGNGLDGHSSLIESNRFIGYGVMPMISSERDASSLTFADNRSTLFDPEIGRSECNAQNVADFLKRFAGSVQLTSITKVVRRAFCGHVYNLQTESSWYIANTIIAHNCRCTTYYKRVADVTPDDSTGDDSSGDDSNKRYDFMSIRDFYRIVEAGV